LAPEGPAALLARLAAHLGGWAALYDASGAVVAAAPGWAARRAARLGADVKRLRERPAPASAVLGPDAAGAEGGDRVELQSLGSGRRTRGVLAVGTDAPLGTAGRYAVNSAVALLTLTTERSRALQDAEARLGAAVLRMLLADEPGHARAVAGELYGALLDEPFRMLVAEAPEGDPEGGLGTLADTAETAASRAAEPVLVVPEGERVVVLARDGGAAVAACVAYARTVEARRGAAADRDGREAREARDARDGGAEPGVAVGLSAAAGPAAAGAAFHQAEQALSVARRRGRALVEHEEVATGSVMPLLADDAVRAFADGLLRALHEHDATGRGDLVASLRAWLARHGQWDAAAADLGVHRHTLRYRMRRVEEILGRSLDDPDVRMELWLALKATTGRP
ncbi:CdaR family transcriptional regulator, partial [Streptomyces sp. UNOB3_S3]|uniref:PucR family transcriptional regulator n=1 Tax=Streptomyces sp. UNOB3_S3 TaxID=2871682 RepID=UPI001E34C7E9